MLVGVGCVKKADDNNARKIDNPPQNVDQNVSPIATIIGKVEETLGGFYVNDYYVSDEESKKYDPKFIYNNYDGKILEIKGRVKNVSYECEQYAECRDGSYEAIYDIQLIKYNNL